MSRVRHVLPRDYTVYGSEDDREQEQQILKTNFRALSCTIVQGYPSIRHIQHNMIAPSVFTNEINFLYRIARGDEGAKVELHTTIETTKSNMCM